MSSLRDTSTTQWETTKGRFQMKKSKKYKLHNLLEKFWRLSKSPILSKIYKRMLTRVRLIRRLVSKIQMHILVSLNLKLKFQPGFDKQ